MEIANRIDGVKQWKTQEGNPYSLMHKELGPGFLCLDIDLIEYRPGKGVVGVFGLTTNLTDEKHIIASKKYIWERTHLEREVLKTIAEKLNTRAFFVIYTTDLSVFHVHNLKNDLSDYIKLNRQEYKDFLKSL